MRSSGSSNPSERIPRRTALASLAFAVSGLAMRTPLASTIGCERATPDQIDRQLVLRESVSIVILPTFNELTTQTDAMLVSATALKTTPSAKAIEDTRAAWRAARGAWKRSSPFPAGPSEDLSITGGAIDAWPAAADKIDALVAGTDLLDEARIATLGANLRGFPGIEHVLFDAAAPTGEADRRLLDDDAAPRRRDLLAAQCADLAKRAKAVRAAWEGPGGYGHKVAEAGIDTSEFGRQRDAVDKIVTAMLAATEATLVAKLAKPLGIDTGGAVRPDLEEAARSDTSLFWIEQDLVGLDALYECRLGDRKGASFAKAVEDASPAAHAAFRKALDDALAKVRATTTPMRSLLGGDRAPLVAVHAAVQVVKRSINTDVASALGASIGFGFSDTD